MAQYGYGTICMYAVGRVHQPIDCNSLMLVVFLKTQEIPHRLTTAMTTSNNVDELGHSAVTTVSPEVWI